MIVDRQLVAAGALWLKLHVVQIRSIIRWFTPSSVPPKLPQYGPLHQPTPCRAILKKVDVRLYDLVYFQRVGVLFLSILRLVPLSVAMGR